LLKQHLRSETAFGAQQSQLQMFGLNFGRAERDGLEASVEDRTPGLFCIPLEQLLSPRSIWG
jgi:hypothetical protein